MNEEPAFPIIQSDELGENRVLAPGLTKRELFAAMAMQGLLANPNDDNVVMVSVIFADALIAELDKVSE